MMHLKEHICSSKRGLISAGFPLRLSFLNLHLKNANREWKLLHKKRFCLFAQFFIFCLFWRRPVVHYRDVGTTFVNCPGMTLLTSGGGGIGLGGGGVLEL